MGYTHTCDAQAYEHTAAKEDSISISNTNKQQTVGLLNQLLQERLQNSVDLEIDGLVVDETITKVGRDFYDIFLMQWEAPPMAKNFTVLIKEQPARGNSSIVSITVNEQKIFEEALQPRYDLIEEVATYMVAVVYDYLLQDQLNQQLEAEGKRAKEVF
ncbi:CsgE family curli-type amyloid fiber assembly protein [uncultured Pontibacter sp.]|uniref:CsgE family curli-type amyloid fiber assembly protein n=1 Tax=uncultured Pontibacter sp. TaxID=453356 RepID=UPI002633188D|nr:CsgE family curli-type amyloid fiber assembly protein [uncultured Pontibacter sp.]